MGDARTVVLLADLRDHTGRIVGRRGERVARGVADRYGGRYVERDGRPAGLESKRA